MSLDLCSKYRPQEFSEILGQDTIVNSLQSLCKSILPPCLLFTGPSGCGKTSTARIIAKTIGCNNNNIIEVDAGKYSLIDDMRSLTDQLRYQPFGTNKIRVIILDEAHRISKAAFDSLLKNLEEPAEGTHWILVSTEPTKIPQTIRTRCNIFELKKVEVLKIRTFLNGIIVKEKFTVDKNIVNLIAMSCEGSPRQALKYLEALKDETDLAKAKDIVKSINVSETSPIINLCRLLVNKCTWEQAVEAVRDMEEDPESVRLGILNYVNKCIINSKSIEQSKYLLQILYSFKEPCNAGEKLAPILLGLAAVLLD